MALHTGRKSKLFSKTNLWKKTVPSVATVHCKEWMRRSGTALNPCMTDGYIVSLANMQHLFVHIHDITSRILHGTIDNLMLPREILFIWSTYLCREEIYTLQINCSLTSRGSASFNGMQEDSFSNFTLLILFTSITRGNAIVLSD